MFFKYDNLTRTRKFYNRKAQSNMNKSLRFHINKVWITYGVLAVNLVLLCTYCIEIYLMQTKKKPMFDCLIFNCDHFILIKMKTFQPL